MHEMSEITKNFAIKVETAPYGGGHINDTYIAGDNPKYILQKINGNVFKDPEAVMKNMVGVTEHLKEKIIAAGGNPDRETINLIETKDGRKYYKADNGDVFRMYVFVDNVKCFDFPDTPEIFMQAACAFGKFQNMLADYPVENLVETIPDFHNTPKRFRDFKNSVEKNLSGRADIAKKEIDFAISREKITGVVVDAMADGSVPLRVTHNDTKLNNVLFDDKTGEGICVIDLDTVMPGSLLYDFGDAIRFGASTGAEDEKDLDKIEMSLELFEAFTKGFLSQVGDKLTAAERRLLSEAAMLMTYECGIRFLADYIDGDTYFKTAYPEHNLVRARTQLKLVYDMEKKLDKMREIVARY